MRKAPSFVVQEQVLPSSQPSLSMPKTDERSLTGIVCGITLRGCPHAQKQALPTPLKPSRSPPKASPAALTWMSAGKAASPRP